VEEDLTIMIPMVGLSGLLQARDWLTSAAVVSSVPILLSFSPSGVHTALQALSKAIIDGNQYHEVRRPQSSRQPHPSATVPQSPRLCKNV
jgi:hypothetical protein